MNRPFNYLDIVECVETGDRYLISQVIVRQDRSLVRYVAVHTGKVPMPIVIYPHETKLFRRV